MDSLESSQVPRPSIVYTDIETMAISEIRGKHCRSISLDYSEIEAIIEFDDAIQSLIEKQLLNESHDRTKEEKLNDEEILEEKINLDDDKNEIDDNSLRE